MSNPFPGMDPYLEGPLWPSFHRNFIEEIARQLTPKLRPKYRTRSGEREVVAAHDPIELTSLQSRIPDVGVFERSRPSRSEIDFPSNVTPAATSPLIFEMRDLEETVQPYVEVRAAGDGTLITAIELLSPTNKRGEGAADFQQKRRELLASTVHYLEIDLLRIGERFPVRNPLPSVPYFVFLSRSDCRPQVEAWPISLDSPLPVVKVPLLPGDPEVELDLALVLRTIYDLYEYDRDIDYAIPPVVPLSVEQQAWVDQRLIASGRR
jgi:hypothetical protein